MTSTIYLIKIDNTPEYVGSSYNENYHSRKIWHLKNDDWLVNVSEDRITFIEIELCEDHERYEREGFHWQRLINDGFILKNKRDPRLAWPSHKGMRFIRSQKTKIKAVNSARKSGKIGNGGKVGGKAIPSIKTRELMSINNGMKRKDVAKKVSDTLKKIIHDNEWNHKISESLKGKQLSDSTKLKLSKSVSRSQSIRWTELRDIMFTKGCSLKQANEIRKSRKV